MLERTGEAIYPSHCVDFRDDYIECLHHHKEAARLKKIQAELDRQKKDANEVKHSEEKADKSSDASS